MTGSGAATYRRRIVDEELDELTRSLPAIAIEGPKGVGKTATASQRARTIQALDRPTVSQVVAADPNVLDDGEPPTLIDEWQRLPQVWDWVRRRVDDGAPAGRFLLTGSAVPASAPVHSGAGRIVSVRMRPLALAERGIADPTVSLAAMLTGTRLTVSGTSSVSLRSYVEEILASGFPAIRDLPGRARRAQLDGYLERVVSREFAEQGVRIRRPQTLRDWLTAYAAATSTAATYTKILEAATRGDASTPAKSTTTTYRDILAQLYLVDPVPGWTPMRNYLGKAAAAPKHQLADPALAARLLGVDAAALLAGDEPASAVRRDGTLLGALFESLTTLSVRTYAQAAEAQVRPFRTREGGHEVDLIVERADQRVVALEVKLAATVDDADVRHLLWLRDRLGDDLLDSAVITTGDRAYRRPDGIAVIPAALLGA